MHHPYTLTALRRSLPPRSRALLQAATAAADEAGRELWAVGGAVRDLGLPAPSQARRGGGDLDLAVDADAEGLARAIAARWSRRGETATVRLAPRFLTASVIVSGSGAAGGEARLDLATRRTERYPRPGALPVVRPGATVEADLWRRDFSVNALALGLSAPVRGRFVDPSGGAADLQAGRLRLLHDRSIRDDPTRLWRAARYGARLGLRPNGSTEAQLREAARWLPRVSGERLWAEFERLAGERRVLAALRSLDRWDGLNATVAGWRLPDAAARALRHRPGPHDPRTLYAVLLAPLPEPTGRAVAARLHPPTAATAAAQWTARLLAELPTAAATGDPEALAPLTPAPDAAARAAHWLAPAGQRPAQAALRRWRRTTPGLDARALRRLGVPPGPAVGRTLGRLRRERYLGNLRTSGQARSAVRRWLAEEASDVDHRSH